ncbi:hypothetical protein VFPFJ_09940 [Purpureocillium lilacinum]|uniref:Uncharacterized protein n=1 Tax=Purpureocillium lilacinum TaxID=33203 RepID=A0A179GEW4_PURLI|nr:hypothetical protein VFPFJ_09940 [Purpureocillium lilacinum]OAQ76372.1 hypothetical protein VFPBJ_08732 [Purpureocillium lilacinum]OAQ79454.1 hypothetical protein VFPFJ_09940 [Purpureocillium lilacinum]
MKLTSTLTTLFLGAALVAASPVETEDKVAKRGGWMSGVCNGTSCKFGLSNWSCDVGKV